MLQLEHETQRQRRLDASATQTIRSGGVSLASLPSTASRVISSSGERAAQRIGAGQVEQLDASGRPAS